MYRSKFWAACLGILLALWISALGEQKFPFEAETEAYIRAEDGATCCVFRLTNTSSALLEQIVLTLPGGITQTEDSLPAGETLIKEFSFESWYTKKLDGSFTVTVSAVKGEIRYSQSYETTLTERTEEPEIRLALYLPERCLVPGETVSARCVLENIGGSSLESCVLTLNGETIFEESGILSGEERQVTVLAAVPENGSFTLTAKALSAKTQTELETTVEKQCEVSAEDALRVYAVAAVSDDNGQSGCLTVSVENEGKHFYAFRSASAPGLCEITGLTYGIGAGEKITVTSEVSFPPEGGTYRVSLNCLRDDGEEIVVTSDEFTLPADIQTADAQVRLQAESYYKALNVTVKNDGPALTNAVLTDKSGKIERKLAYIPGYSDTAVRLENLEGGEYQLFLKTENGICAQTETAISVQGERGTALSLTSVWIRLCYADALGKTLIYTAGGVMALLVAYCLFRLVRKKKKERLRKEIKDV